MFVQSPGKYCITTYIITESGRDNRFLPAPPASYPEFVQSHVSHGHLGPGLHWFFQCVGRENVVVFGLKSGEISLSPPAGLTVITLFIRCDYLRGELLTGKIHSPPFMPPPLPPSWFHKTVTTDCASSLVTLEWVSPTKCYIRTEPSFLLHPSLAWGYFVIFHIGIELAHLLWSFNYSHQNSLQFSTPYATVRSRSRLVICRLILRKQMLLISIFRIMIISNN